MTNRRDLRHEYRSFYRLVRMHRLVFHEEDRRTMAGYICEAYEAALISYVYRYHKDTLGRAYRVRLLGEAEVCYRESGIPF